DAAKGLAEYIYRGVRGWPGHGVDSPKLRGSSGGPRLIRPLKTIALAVLGLAPLVACGPRPVTVTADVTFEDATPAEVAAATGTLAARFKAWSGSYGAQQVLSSDRSTVHIDFHGEAPSDADIRYFAGTQGVYRMFPADQATNLLM